MLKISWFLSCGDLFWRNPWLRRHGSACAFVQSDQCLCKVSKDRFHVLHIIFVEKVAFYGKIAWIGLWVRIFMWMLLNTFSWKCPAHFHTNVAHCKILICTQYDSCFVMKSSSGCSEVYFLKEVLYRKTPRQITSLCRAKNMCLRVNRMVWILFETAFLLGLEVLCGILSQVT